VLQIFQGKNPCLDETNMNPLKPMSWKNGEIFFNIIASFQVLTRETKGKGKGLPRTDHEGPEGE
jgi:hypothetical protein